MTIQRLQNIYRSRLEKAISDKEQLLEKIQQMKAQEFSLEQVHTKANYNWACNRIVIYKEFIKQLEILNHS